MEVVIDTHIRGSIGYDGLSKSQRAYSKGGNIGLRANPYIIPNQCSALGKLKFTVWTPILENIELEVKLII